MFGDIEACSCLRLMLGGRLGDGFAGVGAVGGIGRGERPLHLAAACRADTVRLLVRGG